MAIWRGFCNAILILWQLPQVILGLIVGLFLTKSNVSVGSWHKIGTGVKVQFVRNPIGVCFGPIIYVHLIPEMEASETIPKEFWDTYWHEYGHSRQSVMLGPLYWLVVGLPSLLFNILTLLHVLKPTSYYKRFPENWADKLGGVKRGDD